jgi:hypothetical protein
MFPKKGDDAIHIEGDFLVVPWINVMNPITNDNMPSDIINSFEIIGDDNVQLLGKNNAEATKKAKAVWVDQNMEATVADFMKLKGKIIPVGDRIRVFIPNPGWKAGETHKITVNIIQDHPVKFSIDREIQ